QPAVRVVPDRHDRERIERRLIDPMHRRVGLALELRIRTLVDVAVPVRNGLREVLERHALKLVAGLDLPRELLDRIGLEEVAVVSDVRIAQLPAGALDGRLVEDRPERSRVVMRRLRALVDRERRLEAVVIAVGRLQPFVPAVAPVTRLVLDAAARRGAAARILAAARAERQAHLIEEPLADLVHRDEFLEAGVADVEPGRAAKRERRVSRHHAGIRVARAETRRDVIREAGRILLHSGEVRADLQARDQRAAVLRVRPEQREAARRKQGLAKRRIEHAAKLRIPGVSAAREDHGLARADVNDFPPLVDVAVLPIAFEAPPRLRIEARRVMRLDAQNAARERLLADQLVEVAVQHELNALLARRELERSRERDAVADRTGTYEA